MRRTVVGQGVPRVDGRAKVTGAARYAADQPVDRVLHGYLVLSTIARGEMTRLDTGAARSAPGVVAVYTHRDMPPFDISDGYYLKGFAPMHGTRIHHNGQPVAYVVAETFEQARAAAGLVRVEYRAEPAVVAIGDAADQAYLPPAFQGEENEIERGDVERGLAEAAVRVEASYTAPTHHHNPIEPHATTAMWDGDRLTLYESTQSVMLFRDTVASALGIPAENVRVIAPYLGGGFGTKGVIWPHTLLTAAVARLLGRPVKMVLPRNHMYTLTGHRTEYHQRLRVGATRDGRLTAIDHTTVAQLSRTEEIVFNSSVGTRTLYACPNVRTRQMGVRLDMPTSTWMRSPDMSAQFGLETALDELSYELGIDPVDLRLRNYAEIDYDTGEPHVGKNLAECYRLAADAFGWRRRDRRPGRTRDGGEYVGWGMATERHTHAGFPSSARVGIGTDGRVRVGAATQDIGTGTYTVFTQIAADALGVPMEHVTTVLGDSTLPPATTSAVSATVPSTAGAVDSAARDVRDAVIRIAVADRRSPLHGVPVERVLARDGRLVDMANLSRHESYRDVVARHGRPVEVTASLETNFGHTYGAAFVEVRVHPRLGRVRVTRVVGAYDAGRILNPQTARSQVIGGATWAIGYSLLEHTVVDRRSGRVVNPNLSTYLLPVNADAPPKVEALFVDRPNPGNSQSLGAKGFGETPITGVISAIGNAIFHATGRRLRDVPFTQDKLLL